jgi:prepilin-type N-terminal cleavage/methylation domain-containing protein
MVYTINRGQKINMTFNSIKKERGFTIVELLIVIVVIGILAAITIVAYNGVQSRARNSAAQSAAENVAKKLEAFNAATGAYPVHNTTNNVTAQLATQNESSLTGSGLTIGAPASGTGGNTIRVDLCAAAALTAGATATGYRVYRWDYTTGALATTPDETGGVTTACTTQTN